MYFKGLVRDNPKTGKSDIYYRLVESFRGIDDRVCHRTMVNAGFLGHYCVEDLKYIQNTLTDRAKGKMELFPTENIEVKNEMERLWELLLKSGKVDILEAQKKGEQMINADTIRHDQVQELGSEWLCYQALEQLQFGKILEELGWSQQQINLSLTQIISRSIYPFSELKTSKIIQENSAVCHITGYDLNKITKDKLYENALKLYEVKDAIEKKLSKKTSEIFDLQDKIILYDLTNTYWEGEKRNSKLSQHGRSKEKRSDAKLVVLALVVNQEGFIKYSNIFEGNMSDVSSLPKIIDQLRSRTSNTGVKATVVIDAGISSNQNLALIKEKGYDYVCVSRSKIKDYVIDPKDHKITLSAKKNQSIELQRVKVEGSTDYHLKVKSSGKSLKEQGMKSRFDQRFEEELAKITVSLSKKWGVKNAEKVWERIGRAKEKYPSASKYYQIEVQIDCKTNKATTLTYTKNDKPVQENLGVYFIKTTLDIQQEKTLWEIYNIIREIESTFRSLKTDLDLRPIYHKNDQATMAHIHLAILAYWVVQTIRYQLKKKGIKQDWQEILRVTSTVKLVTTTAKNANEQTLKITKSSEPNQSVKAILQALNYKPKFTKIIKSVVHKPPN